MEIVVRVMVGVAGAFVLGLGAYRERKLNEELERVKKVSREVSQHLRRPPCILVVGLPHHGKSSFINSAFRVLYSEREALIRRSETGPSLPNGHIGPNSHNHSHSHSHSFVGPKEADKEKALIKEEEEGHSHLELNHEEQEELKELKEEEKMGVGIEEEEIDERPLHCTTLRFKSHHIMDGPHNKHHLFSLLDSPPLHPLWLLPSLSTHRTPTMTTPSSDPGFFSRQSRMADEIQRFIESARIYTTTDHDEPPLAQPDCTIIVVSAATMAGARTELMKSLEMLTQAIRNQDLPFIIVFTFKNNVHPNDMKQMMEDTCLSCGTESIYCIDNFVQHPLPNINGKVDNGYDIRSTIVDILRQGLEFCR